MKLDKSKLFVTANTDPDPTVPTTPKLDAKELFVATSNTAINVGTGLLGTKAFDIDVSKHKRYVDDIRLYKGLDHLNKLANKNQSTGGMVLGLVNQIVTGEVVGGTISGLGTMLELPVAIITEMAGGDADFNNVFMELGKGLQDWSKDATPIMRANPNKAWDYNDVAWWLDNGVSIGSSLSMIVPAMAGSRALSVFNKAAQKVGSAGKLGKVDDLLNMGKKMDQQAKNMGKAFASGIVMRNAENMKESLDVVNKIKQEALKKANTEEGWEEMKKSEVAKEMVAEGRQLTRENLSNFIAAKSGWQTYAANSPNIIFDVLQAGALMKVNYFTRSKKIGSLKDRKQIASAQNKAKGGDGKLTRTESGLITAAYIGAGAAGMITEGIEEGINYIGGKYGEGVGKDLIDDTNITSYLDTANKSLGDGHLWEAAFFGALGGGVFQGAGQIMQMASNKGGNINARMKIEEIKKRQVELTKFQKAMGDIGTQLANEEIDINDAKRMAKVTRDRIALNMAYSAARSGNVHLLLEQINDPKFKAKFKEGLELNENSSPALENIEEITTGINETIKSVEQSYNTAVNKFLYRESLDPNTRNQLVEKFVESTFQKQKANEMLTNNATEVTRLIHDNPVYKKAIDEGVPIQTLFEVAALEVYSQNVNYAANKEYLDKQLETKRKIVEEFITKDYSNTKPDIKLLRLLRENVENQLIVNNTTELLASLDNEKDVKKFNDVVVTGLEQDKANNDKEVAARYRKSIEDKVSNLTTEDAIATVDSMTGKDESETKILKSILSGLRKRQENEEKKRGISPDPNKDSTTPTDSSEGGNEPTETGAETDESALTEEDIDELDEAMYAIETNPNYSPKKRIQELENLKAALVQENPNYGPAIDVGINELKESFRGDVRDEHEGYRRDDELSLGDDQYRIIEFDNSYDGDVFATVERTSKDGDTTVHRIAMSSLARLTKKVKETPTEGLSAIEIAIGLNTVMSKMELSKPYKLYELMTEPLLAQLGITDDNRNVDIVVIHDPMDETPAAFDPTTNTIIFNTASFAAKDVTEILEHEMAHAEMYAIIDKGEEPVLTRAEFNALMRTAANRLTLPEKYNGTKTEERLMIIKESVKTPEELLAYALIDKGIREMIMEELGSEFYNKIESYGLDALSKAIQDKDKVVHNDLVGKETEVKKYSATASAQSWMDNYYINPAAITGTGVNGKILVGDVKKYIAENELKQYKQVTKDAGLISEPFATEGNLNFFVPLLNNALDGTTVSAEKYNKYISKFPGSKKISQSKLEELVRKLLSSEFNVGTPVTLEKKGKGVAIMFEGYPIGWVNNPETSQKNLDFAKELDKITDANDIDLSKYKKHQYKLAKWKKDLLTHGVKSKHKPFHTYIQNLERSIPNEVYIHEEVKKKGQKIVTTIARKTSGNIVQDKTKPQSLKGYNMTDLYFSPYKTKGTTLQSVDGKDDFVRHKDTGDFYNDDNAYTIGYTNGMLSGANSMGDDVQTKIPVPLMRNKATTGMADKATALLKEIIAISNKEGGRLPGFLNAKIDPSDKFKLAVKELSKIFGIIDYSKDAHNFIKFYNDSVVISTTNKGEPLYIKVFYKGKKTGKPFMIGYSQDPTKSENKATNKKIIKVTTLNDKAYKDIAKYLKGKTININHKAMMSEDIFLDNKTLKDYVLDNDLLMTDVQPLLDGKGKPMVDERGHTIPAIYHKNDDSKVNANMVLSIRMEVRGEPLDNPVNHAAVPSEIGAAAPKTKTGMDNNTIGIVDALKEGETVNIKDKTQLHAVTKAMPTGYRVQFEHKEDGSLDLRMVRNTTRLKRVKKGEPAPADTINKVNAEKFQSWWSTVFDGVELDTNVKGLLQDKGIFAWGMFTDAMVKLNSNSPSSTVYHEAFHVAFWLYNDETQRNELLADLKEKYPNASEQTLEEILADRFEDYMVAKGEYKAPSNRIAKFFHKLYQLIRNFINRKDNVQVVFDNIREGKFKYKPDQRMLDAARNISRTKPIGTLTRGAEIEAINAITYLIIEESKKHPSMTIREMEGDKYLRTTVMNHLQGMIADLDVDYMMAMLQVTEPDNFNQLFEKTLINVKRQFGITINDSLTNSDEQKLKKDWDDTQVFKQSNKDTVSLKIKQLIMTTQLQTNGKYLGLPTYLDFNKVFPYIQRVMQGANNIEEALNRLEVLGKFDPALYDIAQELKADTSLQSAWVSTFNVQKVNRMITIYSPNSVKNDLENKTSSHLVLADSWINNFNAKLHNEQFGDTELSRLRKLKSEIEHSIGREKVIPNKLISELLNELGIDISPAKLESIFNTHNLISRFGDSKSIYNNVVEPVFAVFNDIEAYNKNPDTYKKFDNYANFNGLAAIDVLFRYDLVENVTNNVNGDMVNNYSVPTFLSNFFDKFNRIAKDNYTTVNIAEAKLELLSVLRDYASDPMMVDSNWLWDNEHTVGMLKLVDGKKDVSALTIDHINLDFISKFQYYLSGGVTNTASREANQYKNMPNNDWEFTVASSYLGMGIRGKMDTAIVPSLVPSDSGNIMFIEAPRFTGVTHEGTVVSNGAIQKAIERIYKQEIARMQQARDLLFDVDDNFNLTLKQGIDYTKLQKHYHYKNVDINGMPILLKNGKATGAAFQFQHFPTNPKDSRFNQGVYVADKYGGNGKVSSRKLAKEHITNLIKDEVAKAQSRFAKYKAHVMLNPKFDQNFSSYEKFITEMTLNQFINNVEQTNFLSGNPAEYKTDKGKGRNVLDPNKRFKQLTSPKMNLSGIGKKRFKVATLRDITLGSKVFDTITNEIAEGFRNDNKALAKEKVSIKNLRKASKTGDVSALNALEKLTYNAVKGYLETNTTDAQGYVSLDRYKEIYTQLGRWDRQMESIWSDAKAGFPIENRDLTHFLSPLKGFYYGREFDPYLKRMVSTQIKYSSIPLIPELVRGTDGERLMKWMNKNKLDEIIFESAQKVGINHTIQLTNNNGRLSEERMELYNERKGYEFNSFSNENWGLQLDVPEHLTDTDNKLGTQIAKIIIANLNPKATYNYDGKKVKGDELVKDYMDTMSANIEEDANSLLVKLGVTKDDNGQYYISDIDKFNKVLKEEVESRNISENYSEAIKLVDTVVIENGKMVEKKEFNMPLFITTMSNKWESVLTALFTNNITNQKQPGGSVVMVSSAFLTTKYNNKEEMSEEEQLVADVFGKKGIQWNKEKTDSGNFKLNPPKITTDENGKKTIIAEALLPRTSKHWTKVNERGHTVEMTIDEIAEQAPEALEQIYYRIPYEKKSSTIVIKIVGFLPSVMSNVMVLPHEAITMSGEDFDVDKRFGMYKNFYKNRKGELTQYRFHRTKSDAAFEQWKQGENVKALREAIASNPDKMMKKATAQKKRFNTLREKAIHQDEMQRIATMLQIDLDSVEGDTKFAKVKSLKNKVYFALQDLKAEQEMLDEVLKEVPMTLELIEASDALREATYFYSNIMNELHYIDPDENTKAIGSETNTSNQSNLIKKYSLLEKALEDDVLRATFDTIEDPYEWNPKKARQNRINDITRELLTHNVHFRESYVSSGFDTAKDIIAELAEVTGDADNYGQFTSMDTQMFLRQRNLDGRILKGMAADVNSFLTVMQVAKQYLRKDLGIAMSYDLNEYDEKTLRKRYKDNIVITKKTNPNVINYTDISETQLAEVGTPIEMYLMDYFHNGRIDSDSYARFGDKTEIKEGTKLRFVKKGETTIDQLVEIIKEDTGLNVTENDIVDFINDNKSAKDFRIKLAQRYEDTMGQGRQVVGSISNRGGTATVRHTKFGWNNDGTYNGANNVAITENTSQILALIVDIVKEGNLPNVNSYTFNIFASMLMTGVPLREAAMFIRQPIFNDLSNYFFEKNGVTSESTGMEISEMKQRYQSALSGIRLMLGEGYLTERDETTIREEGKMGIAKDNVKSRLGYDPNIEHETEAGLVAFTATRLKRMIKYGTEFDLESARFHKKSIEKMTPAELRVAERYLTNQLLLAEKFIKYKEAGEAYQDMLNALSSDRKAVGPSLSKVIKTHHNIHKAAYYPTSYSLKDTDPNVNYTNKPYGDLGSFDNSVTRNLNDSKNIINKVGLYDQGFEGARIFSNVNKVKMPGVMAALPDKFGMSHRSSYPVINTYQTMSADLAFGVLSPQFIQYTPAYIKFNNHVHSATKNQFNEKLFAKINKFVNVGIIGKLDYFNNQEYDKIVGVSKEPQNISTDISLEGFEELSAAGKLAVLKLKNAEKYNGDSHIINYLSPMLGKSDLEFNGYQKIKFSNTFGNEITDDYLVDSFEEMFFSSDPFERSLANDLLRYNYATAGMSLAKNSFSKLIPVSVMKYIGLDTHMKKMQKEMNNEDYIITNFGEDFIDKFIRNNVQDSMIVPYVDRLTYKKGGNWSNVGNTEIVSVGVTRLENEGTKIAESEYLNIPNLYSVLLPNGERKEKLGSNKLYKVLKQEKGLVYYYPVNRLGSKELVELTNSSIVPKNNVQLTKEAYEGLLDGTYTGINRNGKKVFGGNVLQAEQLLWTEATKGFNIDFGSPSEDTEYNTNDLVFAFGQRFSKNTENYNEAKQEFAYNIMTKNLKGFSPKFSEMFTALEAGATVAFPTDLDANFNKTKGIDLDYLLAYKYYAFILDKYVTDNHYDSIVENGIVYYSKKGNDINTISGKRKSC